MQLAALFNACLGVVNILRVIPKYTGPHPAGDDRSRLYKDVKSVNDMGSMLLSISKALIAALKAKPAAPLIRHRPALRYATRHHSTALQMPLRTTASTACGVQRRRAHPSFRLSMPRRQRSCAVSPSRTRGITKNRNCCAARASSPHTI